MTKKRAKKRVKASKPNTIRKRKNRRLAGKKRKITAKRARTKKNLTSKRRRKLKLTKKAKNRLKKRRARRRKTDSPAQIIEELQVPMVEELRGEASPAEEPGLLKGVNLVGFLRAEMGIGESLRLASRSLSAADVPYGILDYKEPVSEGMRDLTWVHKEISEPLYKANIIHLNADALPHARNYFGEGLWHNRHTIGVWHWELPEFPEEFANGFDYVQELWAPTTFIQEIMSKRQKVPVVRIPHGIHVDVNPELNRDAFGLPHDRFLFYMMYDLQSYTQRKNPKGVIQAFKMAFEKDDPNVGLVLKINNPNYKPDDLEALMELIQGCNNIFIINRVLTRIEVYSLLNCTDCYVSLHRAEGFGLGLAEAMFLGKPVIGTNWSGNTDFMNAENSCPVDYQLARVGYDWGPYRADQIWADPDLGQAAGFMRNLVQNPEWRNQIAMKGQQTIRTQFSPQVTGQMMKQRLMELGLL